MLQKSFKIEMNLIIIKMIVYLMKKTNLKTQMKGILNQQIFLRMNRLLKARVLIFISRPFITISLNILNNSICLTTPIL
jgi:hypothetical protein